MWAQFALIQLSYAINTEYGEKQKGRYFLQDKKVWNRNSSYFITTQESKNIK